MYCSSNQLTALDLSKNTELGTLDCSANQLTALDLSQNVNLTKLTCYKNQLTTLDVSQNVKLTELTCYENLLTALDVSQNVKLTKLTCYQNLLTSLNVSGAAALTRLEFFSNQIRDEKMDELIAGLPQNTSTERYLFSVINADDANEGNICMQDQVYAAKTKGWTPQYYEDAKWKDYGDDDTFVLINEANFPDENFRKYLLAQYYGKDGRLTERDINYYVSDLYISEREISDLKGIEFFTELRKLSCNSNQLTSLDLSKNTALTSLECYSNQLTSLDLSKNTALTFIGCSDNLLTSLDVSKNTELGILYCSDNQLTSLDVSKNPALTALSCSGNQLTSLDISKNTALRSLYCYSNQLSSLDLSKNTALKSLDCYKNQINGKNMYDLVMSLPKYDPKDYGNIYFIDDTEGDEGNACTKSQVEEIYARGWRIYYYSSSSSFEWVPIWYGDSFVLGDINGDKRVDVSDYIGVANYILGIEQQGFDEEAGDVNGDCVIDVTDYLGIGNIIHTGSVYGSSASRGQKNIKREK